MRILGLIILSLLPGCIVNIPRNVDMVATYTGNIVEINEDTLVVEFNVSRDGELVGELTTIPTNPTINSKIKIGDRVRICFSKATNVKLTPVVQGGVERSTSRPTTEPVETQPADQK